MMRDKELHFNVDKSIGHVSAIFLRPENARWLMILAHGAGAGIRHPFMAGLSTSLATRGIASFRYNFPYMEQGKKTPDPQPVLIETIRTAVSTARDCAVDLPLLAGGKSLGGRMTSTAAGFDPLPAVRGIVFFGFPLHAPGKPSDQRGAHLSDVQLPMLFLQGTRDTFADLTLLRPLCDRLGEKATLHILDGADHGFKIPKKSGRTEAMVLTELGEVVANWALKL